MKYPQAELDAFVNVLRKNETGLSVEKVIAAGRDVALGAVSLTFDDPAVRTGAIALWDLLDQAEEVL